MQNEQNKIFSLQNLILDHMMTILFCFVLFDSLRPLNNLSVMQDGLPGLNQY